ncbi:MAG: DUF6259 domain-containing protein [Candidatus Sumerlaeota bacterium]|nr:DUF6259 domain-containing protein [Candidatus Sumerlaeota bacterium]
MRPPSMFEFASPAHEVVNADEFDSIQTRRVDANHIQIDYSNHPSQAISVTCAIRSEGDLIRFNISATGNATGRAVFSLRYPQFASPAGLDGNPQDDRVVMPGTPADGTVVYGPGTVTAQACRLYPRQAYAQFLALYGPTAGLYQACYDNTGQVKTLDLSTSATQYVETQFRHIRPEVVGADATVPYDIVLRTFHGDWHDAADIYKEWAHQQPWCANKIAQRANVPQFLKEGTVLLIESNQDNITNLASTLQTYKTQIGIPHVVGAVYGWENRGNWRGIFYTPARPSSQAYIDAAATMKSQDNRLALLTSGLHWVVQSTGASGGGPFDDTALWNPLKYICIAKSDQTAWTSTTGIGISTSGLSAFPCRGSVESRKRMKQFFLDTEALDASLVSFDQDIGAGQLLPCYSNNADHQHPPGYGDWMYTDMRDLCEDILAAGKPSNPDFGLLCEDVSELLIPQMATYWGREHGILPDFSPFEAHGIGLFSYLYHEYITIISAAMTDPQVGLTGSDGFIYACANCLTYGDIPGPFLSRITTASQTAFNNFAMPIAHFPEYLIFGDRRRPPQITVGTQVIGSLTLPAVVQGTFRAQDGSYGTVFANTTKQSQNVTVTLSRSAPAATLCLYDRTVANQWTHTAPGQQISFSIEAYGTRMLVENTTSSSARDWKGYP